MSANSRDELIKLIHQIEEFQISIYDIYLNTNYENNSFEDIAKFISLSGLNELKTYVMCYSDTYNIKLRLKTEIPIIRLDLIKEINHIIPILIDYKKYYLNLLSLIDLYNET